MIAGSTPEVPLLDVGAAGRRFNIDFLGQGRRKPKLPSAGAVPGFAIATLRAVSTDSSAVTASGRAFSASALAWAFELALLGDSDGPILVRDLDVALLGDGRRLGGVVGLDLPQADGEVGHGPRRLLRLLGFGLARREAEERLAAEGVRPGAAADAGVAGRSGAATDRAMGRVERAQAATDAG